MALTYASLALLKSGFRTDYPDINQTKDDVSDWIQSPVELLNTNKNQVNKQYSFLLNTDDGLTITKKVSCLVEKDLQYSDGLVSTTFNSKTITGNGTLWSTGGIQADDWFVVSNGSYRIDSVDSETQITLKSNFNNLSKTDINYNIVRDGLITVSVNPFLHYSEEWYTDDTKNFKQQILTTFTKSINRPGDFIGLAPGDTYYALGIEVLRSVNVSECATVIVTWAKSTDTDVEVQIQKYHSVVAKTAGGTLKLSKADGVGTVIIDL